MQESNSHRLGQLVLQALQAVADKERLATGNFFRTATKHFSTTPSSPAFHLRMTHPWDEPPNTSPSPAAAQGHGTASGPAHHPTRSSARPNNSSTPDNAGLSASRRVVNLSLASWAVHEPWGGPPAGVTGWGEAGMQTKR